MSESTQVQKEIQGHPGQVIIRPMCWHDVDQIVDEFNRTWGEGETVSTDIAELNARHFVLHYLIGTSRARIAELDGRFMGVTLLAMGGQPLLFESAQSSLEAVDAQLEVTPEGQQNLSRMIFWQRLEDEAEAKSGVLNYAQAELKLFLVSADARGHGVGALLWKDMLSYLQEQGANAFFLHTDSSCDVSYYDHIGMDCVASRMGADHPDERSQRGDFYDDIFIYAANLSQQIERWGMQDKQEQLPTGVSRGTN